MTKAKAAAMTFVCPGCGAYGAPDLFSADVDARLVCAQLAKLPADLGPAVMHYLRLWAPRKHALTWKRARIVLDELMPMIEAKQIRRNGRDWPAPAAAWLSAINIMSKSKSLELPVESNGYLLSIIVKDADKVEAAAERKIEGDRKAGKPAASLEEEIERQRAFQLECRTALGFVVQEETLARTKFREAFPSDAARSFLKGRGYSEAVIVHVLGQHYKGDAR